MGWEATKVNKRREKGEEGQTVAASRWVADQIPAGEGKKEVKGRPYLYKKKLFKAVKICTLTGLRSPPFHIPIHPTHPYVAVDRGISAL